MYEDTTFCVDWLRVTVGSLEMALTFAASIGADTLEIEHVTPLPYYSDVRAYDLLRIDWHTTRAELRVCITMTGEHLQAFRLAGGEERTLLGALLQIENLTVTRLDLAMDIKNPLPCPSEIYMAHRKGQMKTHAQRSSWVESRVGRDSAGKTAYVGSRQSTRLIRVYDKALQTGTPPPWVRVELELKKPLAERGAIEVARYGSPKAFKMEMVDFIPESTVAWLDQRIAWEGGEITTPVGRKVTKRETWLYEIALPAVLDAIADRDSRIVPAVRGAIHSIDADGHGGVFRASDP